MRQSAPHAADQRLLRLPLMVTSWVVVLVTPFALTVTLATALKRPLAASSLRAARERLTLTFLVATSGIENDAFPIVSCRFLAAAAAFLGTATLDAVTKAIVPTQLPVISDWHGSGTTNDLLGFACSVAKRNRSLGKACRPMSV